MHPLFVGKGRTVRGEKPWKSGSEKPVEKKAQSWWGGGIGVGGNRNASQELLSQDREASSLPCNLAGGRPTGSASRCVTDGPLPAVVGKGLIFLMLPKSPEPSNVDRATNWWCWAQMCQGALQKRISWSNCYRFFQTERINMFYIYQRN